jgi:hypothetical protein
MLLEEMGEVEFRAALVLCAVLAIELLFAVGKVLL